MNKLIDYINEALEPNAQTFFKLWKKMRNVGPYGDKLYNEVNGWVSQFNLIELAKPEKPTTQPLMTVIISKKQANYLLDVAVTRPGKSSEVEGAGTINNSEMELISSIKEYDKWKKGYRGALVIQYAFPDGFFDRVKANLGDKIFI